MARAFVLAAVAAAITATIAHAETPAKGDCVEIKPATAESEHPKGPQAGVAKDGPGTTGWSSGNSEAGIQKDGKTPGPEAKQPETAKGLDPTKKPC